VKCTFNEQKQILLLEAERALAEKSSTLIRNLFADIEKDFPPNWDTTDFDSNLKVVSVNGDSSEFKKIAALVAKSPPPGYNIVRIERLQNKLVRIFVIHVPISLGE
jgi:hypothetical protein